MIRKPDGWRREKLIDAFKYFGNRAKNKELEQYIMNNYPDIFDTIKRTSLVGSINGQLQFHSKSHGGNNYAGKFDLFYQIKKGLRGMYDDYQYRLGSKIDVNEFISKDLDMKFEEESIKERQSKEYTINRIIRDNKIIKQLKNEYRNTCQICGYRMSLLNGKYYSEGHHLQPLGKHNGPDIKNNIIVLCPNHHTEFDYGVIAVNPNTYDILPLEKYNGMKLNINKNHNIRAYLEYHFNYIYSSNIDSFF